MKDQSFACRRFSNGFFKVQREHLKGLCPRQRHLLMDLLSWADPDTGELETHLDEITEAIDCSKSSAHYVLKALEAKGFIAFSTKTGHHGFVKVRLLKNVSNKDRTKENETCAYGEKDKSALENEALNIPRTMPLPPVTKKKRRNKKEDIIPDTPSLVSWTPEQRAVAAEWAKTSRGLTEKYGSRTIDEYAGEIAWMVNAKALTFEDVQLASRWMSVRLHSIKPQKTQEFWSVQLTSPRCLLNVWKDGTGLTVHSRLQTLMNADVEWRDSLAAAGITEPEPTEEPLYNPYLDFRRTP